MDKVHFWTPGMTLEAMEKVVILAAFRHHRGNKTATASSLGIAIRTLDNKLAQYQTDTRSESARTEYERQRREHYYARATGKLPADAPFEPQGEARNVDTATGVYVEPASGVAEEHAVSVSERKEVQSVLPASDTPLRTDKGRRDVPRANGKT